MADMAWYDLGSAIQCLIIVDIRERYDHTMFMEQCLAIGRSDFSVHAIQTGFKI